MIKTFPPYSKERCFHHQHKTLRGTIFETPNRLILKVGTGNIRPELLILFISEPQLIAACFTSGSGPPWSHLLLKTPRQVPSSVSRAYCRDPSRTLCQTPTAVRPTNAIFPCMEASHLAPPESLSQNKSVWNLASWYFHFPQLNMEVLTLTYQDLSARLIL